MKIEPTPIYYVCKEDIFEHTKQSLNGFLIFKAGTKYKQLGIAEEPIMLATEQGQPRNCESMKRFFTKIEPTNRGGNQRKAKYKVLDTMEFENIDIKFEGELIHRVPKKLILEALYEVGYKIVKRNN